MQNKINVLYTDMVSTVRTNVTEKFCTAMGNKQFPFLWGRIFTSCQVMTTRNVTVG